MKGMGLTLDANDIYNDSTASLKDAVVIFGRGCTGVMVSDKGLVFTNHHCGFDAIQQLSTINHNYLKNGFSAKNQEDEIPAPGLTVTFLVKIQDVTNTVVSQIPDTLLGSRRTFKQDSICSAIEKEAMKGNEFTAQVKSFYSDNEFYLFIYQKFKDIRLAFTPPQSIGKFGGETDNWMWPRHTADFSVFRVYASPDGKPAEYSKDNVPYSPKRFATISNQGYQPDDYAMIIGNPGSTSRYLTSWGIENRINSNQARIDVRGAKQDNWKKYMRSDEAIMIAYASKYARSSNYWKNSIGMNNAIAKLNVTNKKKVQQKAFTNWVNGNSSRKNKYGNVLETIEDGYTHIFKLSKTKNYLTEALISGSEMPQIASKIERMMKSNYATDSIIKSAKALYKDYYPEVDKSTIAIMLDVYKKSVDAAYLPPFYKTIDKKFDGNFNKYAEYLFSKSSFSTFDKFSNAIKKGKLKIESDPALIFSRDVKTVNQQITFSDEYIAANEKIDDSERMYEAGLKEMSIENGTSMYPDANSTMRLTYGKIDGYQPADAVDYKYYTTTNGILEKEKKGDFEFDVPEKLETAIKNNDYGRYIDARTGEMHVAFLSNTDITGGNSGSPIFNAKGELLGLAFDGNWEAMSGDIVFEPNLQRTISVDVRYILFIMDKIGGAERLVNELTIK